MYLEGYGYSHILGGLIGHALGDAWAMPALYRPRQTWEYYGGWLDSLLPAPPDHPFHADLQAGQITGNTQQALALAQIIIAEQKITVEGAAKAILNWYNQIDGDNSPYVDLNTRQAVSALNAGEDPHTTGVHNNTSGGAMWISPIGLIYPGQPEAAVEDAITACTPTHFTDVAISGACAVAAAIARATTPDTTLEDIIDVAVWGADIGGRYGVPWVGASVSRKIEFAVQLATNANLSEEERIQNLYDLIGSTPVAADAVPCAFGILALADGNPINTAIYAAALSGDASTVGSMACALAGAWQGAETIPTEFVEFIRQANPLYDFDAIATGLDKIAQQNYAAAPEPEGDKDFIEGIMGQDT